VVQSAIKTLIDLCTRRPWWVLGVSVLLAIAAGVYSARHFAINTDVTRLISPHLPWRQRELTFNATFPQGKETIIAVIDAPTSEAASKAAQSLTSTLSGRKTLFKSVEAASETPFFAREAMLFLPTDQVAATAGQLQQSAPLIRAMAGDPSLRGLAQALSFGLQGAQQGAQQNGEAGLAPLAVMLNQAAATLDALLVGKPGYFSWRELVSGKAPEEGELRRFVEIHPVLDYGALEPGRRAKFENAAWCRASHSRVRSSCRVVARGSELHSGCSSSARPTFWRWRVATARSRSSWRRTARCCGTSSTSRRWARCWPASGRARFASRHLRAAA